MVFLFFYFEEFKRGMVCRVNRGLNEGLTVVVDKVDEDMLWCYENKPVTHRLNSRGKWVIDVDPACFTSLYKRDMLNITNQVPKQTDGWGASYRNARLSLNSGGIHG
ncbi:hypothetical protein QUF95_15580 [Paenibacillus silvae]|nr:hypothetical protein [Paenibacillus silvae]